jgi:uncharacterized lipoprotein YddW (UPF0748 family)
MRRRRFLELLGNVAGAGLLARYAAALDFAAPNNEFTAWTWFHGNNTSSVARWRARFARLRAAGITGVLVADGNADRMAAAAHAEGLTFHRWMFMMYRSHDRWAKRNHPEWFAVSRNGESCLTKPPYVPSYNWLCPNRDGVREYLRRAVDREAVRQNVDAVHLDYIRFIDVILPRGLWSRYNLVQDREMPQYDFCYCSVCREKFKAQSGVDPMTLEDAPSDVAWREFRWNSITEVVRLLADTVHARGKKLSAAVFATPALARQCVRQAWETWPLDFVFPMLYHNFYLEDVDWIGAAAREGVQALQGRRPLVAGLFVPRLTPAELARAVALSRDAGASGVALFSMPRLTDAHLKSLAETLRSAV